MERQADGQTDRQRRRQTDRDGDRQTHRQAGRQKQRENTERARARAHTHTHTHTHTRARAYKHMCVCAHTLTHTVSHTHARVYIYWCTHQIHAFVVNGWWNREKQPAAQWTAASAKFLTPSGQIQSSSCRLRKSRIASQSRDTRR